VTCWRDVCAVLFKWLGVTEYAIAKSLGGRFANILAGPFPPWIARCWRIGSCTPGICLRQLRSAARRKPRTWNWRPPPTRRS
jgi:hypothetical protein